MGLVDFASVDASLCSPQSRLAQTVFSQGNSDSTRTFDQAQSSSSDAAAQQQLQEIESLKAEAAQVRCGLSSYH